MKPILIGAGALLIGLGIISGKEKNLTPEQKPCQDEPEPKPESEIPQNEPKNNPDDDIS